MEDEIFNPKNEVKTQTIKWGKVGDWLKGTLTDNTRKVESSLSPGTMQTIFEFKIHGGQFHNILEDKSVATEPTVLNKGDFWTVYAKPALADRLRNVKLGQIVGLRYAELRKPTQPGFNGMKIISVYPGEMDADYQGEQPGDMVAGVNEASDEE